MNNFNFYVKLLKDITIGLKNQGYTEEKGNDIFKILDDGQDNKIKIFLNCDKQPSTILVRYSYNSRLGRK